MENKKKTYLKVEKETKADTEKQQTEIKDNELEKVNGGINFKSEEAETKAENITVFKARKYI